MKLIPSKQCVRRSVKYPCRQDRVENRDIQVLFWSGITWWTNQGTNNKLFLPWTNVNFSMSSSFPSAILKFFPICAHSSYYTAAPSLTDYGFVGLDGTSENESNMKAFWCIFENVDASSSRSCGFSGSCWDWRNPWRPVWKVKRFAVRCLIVSHSLWNIDYLSCLANISTNLTWNDVKY